MNRIALTCPVLSGLSDASDSKRLSGPVRSVRFAHNLLTFNDNVRERGLSDYVRTARQGVMCSGHLGGKGKPPLGGFPFPPPGYARNRLVCLVLGSSGNE